MINVMLSLPFFLAAAGLFVLGVRHLREKGPPLNNGFLFAPEEERGTMDKKSLYRQSGTVFCLLSAALFFLAVGVLTEESWPLYLVYGTAAAALVYGIASSVKR